MFLKRLTSFKPPFAFQRRYVYSPTLIDQEIPRGPHGNYILTRRGFAPKLKFPLYNKQNHISEDALMNFPVHPILKSRPHRFPRPFDHMDYKSICRYVEWSYPYIGLDIVQHVQNLEGLVGPLNPGKTYKMIDLYKLRYNIQDKQVYDRSDLEKLIKPSKAVTRAISNKKKRVFSYFVMTHKEEIRMRYQELLNENPGKKISFSSATSEVYKTITDEKIEEIKKIVEEDWQKISEIYMFDEIKKNWKNRTNYCVPKDYKPVEGEPGIFGYENDVKYDANI